MSLTWQRKLQLQCSTTTTQKNIFWHRFFSLFIESFVFIIILVSLFLDLCPFCQFWILWVVFAENPQETELLLLGTPRGLKPCCIGSMQSCEPTKMALSFVLFLEFLDFYWVFAWGHSKSEVWGCDQCLNLHHFYHIFTYFCYINDAAHDDFHIILQKICQQSKIPR
jgi:hypothetical protein